MAKIIGKPRVELRVWIGLEEEEARALDALVGYGDAAFISTFYEKLGRAYMEKHEAGLRSLFASVREFMPAILNTADEAQKVFQSKT
jgi:hypothetical protein